MTNKEFLVLSFMIIAALLLSFWCGIQTGKIVGYEYGALDQKNGNITWETNAVEKVTYKLNPALEKP